MGVAWGHEAAWKVELGGILWGEPRGEDGAEDETEEKDGSERGQRLGAGAEAKLSQPAFVLLFFEHRTSIACKASSMQAQVR